MSIEVTQKPLTGDIRRDWVRGALHHGLRRDERMAIEAFACEGDGSIVLVPNELAARRVGVSYEQALIAVGAMTGRGLFRRSGDKILSTFAPHSVMNYGPSECFVYAITDGQNTKVGVTKSIGSRLRQLNTGSPKKLRLHFSHLTDRKHALIAEAWVHDIYAQWRLNGEWFAFSPDTFEQDIRSAVSAKHDVDLRHMFKLATT